MRANRLIAAFLVAAVGSVVVACGGDSNADGDQDSGKKYNVVFVSAQKGNPVFVPQECGMKLRASQLGNVNLELTGPTTADGVAQAEVVTALASKKPDAVVVNVSDSKALVGPLKRLADGGTKIIEVDSFSDFDGVSARVGINDEDAGRQLARMTAELVGEEGTVLPIMYDTGYTTVVRRNVGLRDEMKKFPGIKLMPTQYAKGDASRVAALIKATEVKESNLKAVVSEGSFTGELISALFSDPSIRKDLKGATIDVTEKLAEGMESGAMSGLINQQKFKQGEDAMQIVVDVLEGKPVEKLTEVPTLEIKSKEDLQSQETRRALEGC